MSLLMKALEKAAKDRGDAQAQPAADALGPSTAALKAELSLEPLAAETPVLASDARTQPGAAGAMAPSHSQARASTVIQAGARSGNAGGFGAYIRTHPIIALAAAAGIFLAGFGVYVYLQIANPGLFIRQPPPAPQAPVSQVQAPQPAAAPPVPQPLDTARLIQPAPEPAPQQPVPAPVPRSRPAAVAAAPSPSPESPRNAIVVSRGSASATVSPALVQAYAALQAGHLDQAQRLYDQLLRAEPRNIDALLGLAAIAMQESKNDDATRHYLRILELDPRHALAQSGLLAIIGRADPLAAETRLKQLIAREPSPFLYFTLGNLYADQSQWAQAQQAYFQAYHLEPANPDYAYNLAVGLEHLGQHRFALDFYRRAVQLAPGRGHINFSLAQTQERISKLASRVE